MARFDVHRRSRRNTLVLDCQADALREFDTRVVAPLQPLSASRTPVSRLHPRFQVDGREYVLLTHLLTAVPVEELGPSLGSWAEHSYDLTRALDLLLTGV